MFGGAGAHSDRPVLRSGTFRHRSSIAIREVLDIDEEKIVSKFQRNRSTGARVGGDQSLVESECVCLFVCLYVTLENGYFYCLDRAENFYTKSHWSSHGETEPSWTKIENFSKIIFINFQKSKFSKKFQKLNFLIKVGRTTRGRKKHPEGGPHLLTCL